jgi:hypothetical protein
MKARRVAVVSAVHGNAGAASHPTGREEVIAYAEEMEFDG